MGTRKNNTSIKKVVRCSICRQVPKAECDWRQGRCPHLPPVLKLTLVERVITFFKRKKSNGSN